ncbi:hypothetical protein ACFO25_09840 [Paenactinomyces guangxiensis]|uniref:Uncharacterized protein n=1 Tax=Paenactinomyces guangxiensis TaxID=1490290 RepID=A0A7W1WS56_9BACL|nr:hypothetical protein [Paenactinomyces guangxiensis]MBA4495085.1 hypothetical protein [Paenactinomyces guangxiensis]MBH8592231.1 hypothetical protein [Paenactinomyces guangxiensis]
MQQWNIIAKLQDGNEIYDYEELFMGTSAQAEKYLYDVACEFGCYIESYKIIPV